MYAREENNYPKAVLISTIIMGALIAISFLIVISSFKPEGEFGMGGIVVNYGTVETGMGSDFTSIEDPSMAPNANGQMPDKITPEQVTQSVTAAPNADNILTQNTEEAVALNAKTSNKATPSSADNTKNTPAVNQNALYKGKSNNGTGRGDGTGNTPGNQGSINGDPLAPNYGEGGSGFGDTPLELGKFTNITKPEDDGQERGRIAIRITISAQGVVTNAELSLKGSTNTNKKLVDKSIKAMLGARYSGGVGSSGRRGIVIFNYGVN